MKYNYRDSIKSEIDRYDKLIMDTIKQIKLLQKLCKNYQRVRAECHSALKEHLEITKNA